MISAKEIFQMHPKKNENKNQKNVAYHYVILNVVDKILKF